MGVILPNMQAKRCVAITVRKTNAKHEHTFYIIESNMTFWDVFHLGTLSITEHNATTLKVAIT